METDKLIEGAVVVSFIKAHRIKWLGHIQRMDQARPTRKLLDWKPVGTRPVGRPRQRWQEDVMEDLKVKNWKETAKDRRIWRDLAEKAKTHKGLPWLISNLMHKILIYLHVMHLLKSSTCFENYHTHLQEVYVVIVFVQPLVSSLSAGDCLMHRLRKNSSFLTGAQDSHLQRVTIPEAAYVQLRRRPPEDEHGNSRNM